MRTYKMYSMSVCVYISMHAFVHVLARAHMHAAHDFDGRRERVSGLGFRVEYSCVPGLFYFSTRSLLLLY